MTLNLSKYISSLLITALITAGIHYLVYRAAPSLIGSDPKYLFEIYIFLIILNTVHFIGLRLLFIKWAKYAGLLFTGLSLIKMGISLLFLLPYIFPSTDKSVFIVINFMTVYFIMLTVEVLFIAKSLNKK